jgi:hypothetical protein
MSAVPSTAPAPARKSTLATWMTWIAGAAAATAAIVVLVIAVWPASETEKARDDGERVGAAVAQVQSAGTTDEVDDALAELQDALHDTRAHGYDAVTTQVDDQGDALYRAADGYVGSLSSDDDFEQAVYNDELDAALSDLENNAQDFQSTGPEVQQAFWDGYETGLNGA